MALSYDDSTINIFVVVVVVVVKQMVPRSILAGVSGGNQNETRVSSDSSIHGMMSTIT